MVLANEQIAGTWVLESGLIKVFLNAVLID